jgi:hypothetical protein
MMAKSMGSVCSFCSVAQPAVSRSLERETPWREEERGSGDRHNRHKRHVSSGDSARFLMVVCVWLYGCGCGAVAVAVAMAV